MRPRPGKLVLPIAGLAAVAVLVALSVLRSAPVEVGTVRRGPVRSFVEEEGRTRVAERYVLAAPVDGRLLRLERREGDLVRAGEVLAEIDPLALRSRVEETGAQLAGLAKQLEGVGRKRPKAEELRRARLREEEAEEAVRMAERELQAARAARDQARREAERARALLAEGTIAAAEAEEAELRAARAEADHAAKARLRRIRELERDAAKLGTAILAESARDVDWEEAFYRESIRGLSARLAVLRDDLVRARITSPVDGVVLKRYRESETPVTAGALILEVGDLSRLEVTADVLSEDAARMRPGMPVEILGRALGDRVLPGKLSRIHPSAFRKVSSLGVEQQRVTIEIAFDPAGTSLGDRYRVDVRVILEAKEAVPLVPEAALFRRGGRWRAFRVEGGRARLAAVETGLRDGRVREVISGLSEGDRVILHPDDTLEDGARVRPREGE